LKDGAAVTATPKTACCTAKAKCTASPTCPAGMKAKTSTGFAAIECASASCSAATCCDPDDTKCKGSSTQCESGFFLDPLKDGAAVTATPKTACCTAKAKCTASPTCPAGMKAKTSTGFAAIECASASCSATTCCDPDATKCGGAARQCDSGFYLDTSKAGAAVTATPKTACCTAKATCTAPGGGTTAAGGTTGAGDASDGQQFKPSRMGLLFAAAGAMTYWN